MDVAASEFWLEDSGDYDLDFKTADNDVSHREYRWQLGRILLEVPGVALATGQRCGVGGWPDGDVSRDH